MRFVMMNAKEGLAQSEGLEDIALGTHGGLRSCHVVEAADPLYLIKQAQRRPIPILR